jgi:hypothetical protein
MARAVQRDRAVPDAPTLRRRASGALRELLARIGDRRPLVLFIDDLQWGDLDSAALLSALLAPPDPPILLVVACYRSEGASVNPCLRVLLGTDGRGVPEDVRHEIVVDRLTFEETGRLPREARRLLEALAVAGRPLRRATACRAAGLGAVGLEVLDLLRAHHFVRGTGPGTSDDVEAYHDRIREHVLREIPPEDLPRRHRGLAEAMELSGQADPESLAFHCEAAGDPGKASRYYTAAAGEAARALAFDRAARLYRSALWLTPEGDPGRRLLWAHLGDALAGAGRGAESAEAYQAAAAGAGSAEALEMRRRAAFQFLAGGHFEEGFSAFGEVLEGVGLRFPSTPRRALLRALADRATLRVRGIRFRERREADIDPDVLHRIDVVASAAAGLIVIDTLYGASFQTRSLLMALRAGEPHRIAAALSLEVSHSALPGLRNRRQSARLLEAAEALARRVGDARVLGMATVAAGTREFFEGRFGSGVELLDHAAAGFRDSPTGVYWWELDTARVVALWCLYFRGALGELGRRVAAVTEDARQRGHSYIEITLGAFLAPIGRLAADDPAAARDLSDATVRRWPRQQYCVHHMGHFLMNLYLDLYEGDAPAAWRRVTREWPAMRASQLSRIQIFSVAASHHKGRCALGAAAAARDPEPLLRAALRCASRLDREGMAWAAAEAALIRAGVASLRGDLETAARGLREAVAGFDADGIEHFAAAARRRLGELLGGDEGRALVAQADAWMTAQPVKNPPRMTACLAPGFPEP